MIYTKLYTPPPTDEKEVLRYAKTKELSPEIDALLKECIKEAMPLFSYKVCYGEFDISEGEEILEISKSESLKKALCGCSSFILFAATVGPGVDRLINRYSHTSPAKAFMINAIATERIESLCDMFCEEMKEEKEKSGFMTKPRISAGYGDMPLTMQKKIFSILDCPRKIGVSLGESLLMSPRKSVTAIVGVCDR